MKQAPLPIDALLPEIVDTCRTSQALVLQAAPGAGKTTRVPRALLEAGLGAGRQVVVLQPRRLATRMAAWRVAEELGEEVGQSVGYQVRFETVASPETKLFFVTEGVLTRKILTNPTLNDVGVVVLDEFHERHLAGDLALALLRRLQLSARPDLKLIVMSATLETGSVSRYLGNCPVLSSEGRAHEVTVEHLPEAETRPLDQLVLSGVKKVVASNLSGHVLVFLPGAAEIRRARASTEDLAHRHGLEVHALHGDLSNAEQDRAVRPGKSRRLILSTNVAETSVTIEGVGVVIDSGLARIATHSPWSGLPMLKVAKVSKASAIQRAGRAGRTRAGHCLRLFSRSDFERRVPFEVPEIQRLDLTDSLLALRALGANDLTAFPFFEPPPASSIAAADELLRRLGATSPSGEVTLLGRRLLALPLHPRLGRIVAEAEQRGLAAEGATIAALLGEKDIREETRARLREPRGAHNVVSGPSDVLEMIERFQEAHRANFDPARVRSLGLDSGAVQAVERARRQLSRAVDRSHERPAKDSVETALLKAVLTGFPERVARRRRDRESELLLCGGAVATLADTSAVTEARFLVTIDAEERAGPKGTQAMVRTASMIEPEWLIEHFASEVIETDAYVWNKDAERVDRVSGLSYLGLVLDETRQPAPGDERAAELLAKEAVAQGLSRFTQAEALERWRARVEFLVSSFPEAGFPPLEDAHLEAQVRAACQGLRSFAELREASLVDRLAGLLTSQQAHLLAQHAPARITLAGGRQVQVNYERGKPPWIESRLQDFFGSVQGPRLGRTSLLLHLLAPNQRAVQITTDLAGFWERHYPAIRKELQRKYPKHSWPEDPVGAQPPAPRRR